MTQSIQKIRDYTVLSTLGQNREGGRITHLAQAPDGSKVVIKEFRFVTNSKWDDYSAIAREIEILKTLDHPRIPKFLESFETEQGACLVQQYIEAPNLDQKWTYTTDQVYQIAQDLLEILVYLQSLTPPVLHRDIKPGNLLLDGDHNLYLVDFGFSRIGLENVAVSSMVRGTTGFMPPEQMLGLDLTKSSDLYSVSATLICLMLGIPSGRMAQLMDIGENRLKFSDRLPSDIDPHFVRWLKRMTEPRAGDRFADAAAALNAINVVLSCHEEWDAQPYYSRTSSRTSKSLREQVKLLRDKYSEPSLAPTGIALTKAESLHLSRPEDKDLELAYSKALEEHNNYLHHEFLNYDTDTWLKPWHLYVGYVAGILASVSLLVYTMAPPEINHTGYDGKPIAEKSELKQAHEISKTLPKSIEVSESQNEQQFFENYFGAVPGFVGFTLLIFVLGSAIKFIQDVNFNK